MPELALALSDAAAAFVPYWRSLRQCELVPQSARFLDCADPRFQPYISFNDVDPSGDNVVSLVGTALSALMQRDLTGLSTSAFLPPAVAENLRQDYTMCSSQPCGMWETSNFATSANRSATLEIVTLPLKLGTSPRYRIARFHRVVDVLHSAELMTVDMRWKTKQWIGIDGGLPSRAPLPSAMPPR
ncbi:MAG: PAS domain-containing protein [Rhodospirillaceae bacterium]|nr:PAS domain-containing protein [Rhodospirillaceae bacterium]